MVTIVTNSSVCLCKLLSNKKALTRLPSSFENISMLGKELEVALKQQREACTVFFCIVLHSIAY